MQPFFAYTHSELLFLNKYRVLSKMLTYNLKLFYDLSLCLL